MKCQRCRTNIQEENKYCQNCGEEVNDSTRIINAVMPFLAVLLILMTILFSQKMLLKYKKRAIDSTNYTRLNTNISIIDDSLIKTYVEFNKKAIAIPVGIKEKLVDGELTLIDENNEFYCLVGFSDINYDELISVPGKVRQQFKKSDLKVGQINQMDANGIDWFTVELEEANNKTYLAAYTRNDDKSVLSLIIVREDNKIDYEVLNTLMPLAAKL